MRIRLKALIPIGVTLLSIVSSEQFLAILPDKYAHIIAGIGALVTAFSPAVVTNKPSSTPTGS